VARMSSNEAGESSLGELLKHSVCVWRTVCFSSWSFFFFNVRAMLV
jgi:hypothetical protein